MKLSEAIRTGAKLRPQARGSMYKSTLLSIFWPFAKRASCALGAAYEAGGKGSRFETSASDHRGFRGEVKAGQTTEVMLHPDEWNDVFFLATTCPQCPKSDELNKLIPHLNDDHRWTREEIALFVERLEQTEAQRVQCVEHPDLPKHTKTEDEWPEEIGVP